MTRQQIETAIYNWVKAETGLANVIFVNQDGPRPAIPYASIEFLNPALRVGSIDEIRFQAGDTPDEDEFVQTGLRTSLVSLNIFGEGANDLMSKLRDTLDRPDIIETFDFAHIDENGPIDLTELEETKTRERSQMDLTIMYAIERETNVVPIEEVEIKIEGGPLDGTTIEIDIEN